MTQIYPLINTLTKVNSLFFYPLVEACLPHNMGFIPLTIQISSFDVIHLIQQSSTTVSIESIL